MDKIRKKRFKVNEYSEKIDTLILNILKNGGLQDERK